MKNSKTIISFPLYVILLIALLIRACGGCDDNQNEQAEKVPPDSEDMRRYSHIISEYFVKQKLKSPSTADFPMFDYTSEYSQIDGTYLVASYVDAQNGFGSMVRQYYSIKLKFNGGEFADPINWTATELKIRK